MILRPGPYCFFIDGLDELTGETSSLVSLIRKISQYPNVKVCVTSRLWIIFEDEFSKPQLTFQNLTYVDIKRYPDSELGSSVAFNELQRMDKISAEALMENIAEKSSGVFLWVVLVARSLKEGLRDGDRLPDLHK
ncbi:hypothetical protein EDB81DRAFT_884315 [Dactylonectria macrodidyma]|uniref:NACHT domain-containing protein n=1 Tax=Dactylonectria macrodidyma TaxID=307937 RepID=A0A9P9ETL2_9HYPO|nr:hypothetical protein EDB81DRAFT_884315 [Dactylonectria macrodidyma]